MFERGFLSMCVPCGIIFQQMHWAMCEGMGSLVRLQPKSVIVAILIAAKWSVGNDLVVSLQSYE